MQMGFTTWIPKIISSVFLTPTHPLGQPCVPGLFVRGSTAVSLNDKIYSVGGQLHGQIAWYKFDGDFNDSSGNNLILSDNGVTLTSDRNGDAVHALNFDGTDDTFSINYGTIQTPVSNFAYAFWAKPLATTLVATQASSVWDCITWATERFIFTE